MSVAAHSLISNQGEHRNTLFQKGFLYNINLKKCGSQTGSSIIIYICVAV